MQKLSGKRIINDKMGLMVYKAEPKPLFLTVGSPIPLNTANPEILHNYFDNFISANIPPFSERMSRATLFPT